MSTKANLRIAGLATDPNPLTTSEAGALRQAYDIICRDGIAEPRPSFDKSVTTKSVSYRPRSMHVYSGSSECYVSSFSGTPGDWRVENLSGTINGHVEPPMPLDTDVSLTQWAEARRNLYYATGNGIYKLTSSSDTAAEVAGYEPPCNAALTAAAGSAISNNTTVAYRYCFRRLASNDVVIRSAPSPWQQYTNTSGAGRQVSLRIPFAITVAAGDWIEVYRTQAVASGSTPSDICQLAYEYQVTSTDISNGYTSVTDTTAAADLGRELYTNPTREGIESSNYMPPICASVAQWNECMWYGNTRRPAEIQLNLLLAGTGPTGISYVPCTISFTSGSVNATVTAGGSQLIVVGALVSEGTPRTAGTYVPTECKVVSYNSGTGALVLSKAATGTTAGTSCVIHHIVSLTYNGGSASEFYASNTYSATATTFVVQNSASSLANARLAAASLAQLITERRDKYVAWSIEDTTVPRNLRAGSIIIRIVASEAVQNSTFTVSITTFAGNTQVYTWGDLVNPSSPTSTSEVRVNRVSFSKPDEPEHVPLLNWIAVGNEIDPIYQMVPAKSALIIFKRDGIFAITGSPPYSWRVDKISGISGLFGSGACEYDGIVYAITSDGFVAVTPSGVQNLSRQRISREIDTLLASIAADVETGEPTWGLFCAPMVRKGVVLFGLPSASRGVYADRIYAYHVASNAWSRWDMDAYCAAASVSGGVFYLARYNYWEIRRAKLDAESTGYDRSYSISAWTYTAGTPSVEITDANLGNWEPKVGDWVACTVGGTAYYLQVTAVTDPGATKLLTIHTAFPSGAQSSLMGYEAVISIVEWQPFAGPDKFTAAFVREQQITLDLGNVTAATHSSALFTMGAKNDRTATRDTITVSESRAASEPQSMVLRMTMGRNVARLAHCYPYFWASNLDYPWILTGCALVFETGSERVQR